MIDKSKFNSKEAWRQFGIALGIILAIIATVLLIRNKPLYPYFYGAALFLITAAATVPIVIKPLFILFSYIGYGMSKIMAPVLLTLLFYLGFTPIALIGKLFGKKFLALKLLRKADSYWIENPAAPEDAGGYENQF
ncbi:MAG: hypothetical protein GY757_21125 [bacterium]|nr:hypothetical protein [bacterium]